MVKLQESNHLKDESNLEIRKFEPEMVKWPPSK